MSGMPPFDQDSYKIEFLRRLNEVPGIDLPPDVSKRRPGVLLAPSLNEASLTTLFNAPEWFLAEATNPTPLDGDT